MDTTSLLLAYFTAQETVENNHTRIYSCGIHVDIINGKIWVQHDSTEKAIAE
ncbi:MAG: element excision factor XisI family protein [Trichodesmium sp. MO_231.B1]|uniref:element excision factor XisI family protein n=1 Tax=Okeania sp. SIO2F4 TaxID=2607790 RepID=UPI0025DE73B5|nr:element excision factor XisI family protein [Okeania sp. SIO2F4]MDJ0517168.1 element excision factor XisI family protein [Trichodesmium sp. MO_231.B1]